MRSSFGRTRPYRRWRTSAARESLLGARPESPVTIATRTRTHSSDTTHGRWPAVVSTFAALARTARALARIAPASWSAVALSVVTSANRSVSGGAFDG